MTDPSTSRRLGSIIGLAVGDAVGTTVEFQPAGSFVPLAGMVGGGPFDLPAGAWTDDTSMALCLAESLVECRGFDAADQMRRYVRQWRDGYWSSTGECFDIGITTRQALARFEVTGDPWSGSDDPKAAGNGSVMRLAPVVAWAAHDPVAAVQHARESSRTTHGARQCVDGRAVLARLLLAGYIGGNLTALLEPEAPWSAALRAVAAMDGAAEATPAQPLSGCVVDTLGCARWAEARGRSFGEAMRLGANLGGGAETIAAVTGNAAGGSASFRFAKTDPQWWKLSAYLSAELMRVLQISTRRQPW